MFWRVCIFVAFCCCHQLSSAASFGEELVANCSATSNLDVFAPTCVYGPFAANYGDLKPKPCTRTTVNIAISLERFYSIEDTSQVLSFGGTANFYWVINCPDYTPPALSTRFNVDPSIIWKPKIVHYNAESDFAMVNQMSERVSATSFQMPPGKMSIILEKSGVFSSTQQLNIERFPFDKQNASVTFIVRESMKAVFLNRVEVLAIAPDFMPQGSGWKFATENPKHSCSSSIGQLFDGYANKSISTLNLMLHRKPDFYVYNLMVPCCLLTALLISSFMLHPLSHDRPAFCVTLLLATTVLQNQVVQFVPALPQRSFLSVYCDASVILSWAITLYMLAINGISVQYPVWSEKCNRKLNFKISNIRSLDCIAFTVGFLMFVGINSAAVFIAMS